MGVTSARILNTGTASAFPPPYNPMGQLHRFGKLTRVSSFGDSSPVSKKIWIFFGFYAGVCVCCFVLLYRYWGIVTVPGSLPYGSRPGVAESSPFTLTTSLAIPVPFSSSSNGPTTVPLTTMGLTHGGSVSWAGPKFVRPHW